MDWFTVIFIAIIVETLTELFKLWFPKLKEREWVLRLCTIVIGIILCISCGADVFQEAGISEKVPLIGNIITGILVAGGSNIIYDIISKVRKSKTPTIPPSSTDVDPDA